jgi:hypothetical protein
MSEGSGPDPFLQVDITGLQQGGANLGELSGWAGLILGILRDGLAAYPPVEAFGSGDQTARIGQTMITPGLMSSMDMVTMFLEALAKHGEDVGALGGVFGNADDQATDVAQNGGLGRH